MKRATIAVVLNILVAVFLAGCFAIPKNQKETDVEERQRALQETTAPRPVRIVAGPYVGATPVVIPVEKPLPPVFQTPVTLRMTGTIDDFAQRIDSMLPIRIQLQQDGIEPVAEGAQEARAHIKYTGLLQGLLDMLASRFNMGWQYKSSSGLVVFSKYDTRMYSLFTAPGTLGFEGTITNKSSIQGASGATSAVGQAVSSSDVGAETAQSSYNRFEINIWAEVESNIKSMLSEHGVVVVSPASGTITVTDKPIVLDRVGQHIEALNTRLSRQVALSVKVWALELTDNAAAGFDLEKILFGSSLSLESGGATPYRALDGLGSITATILDGSLDGSAAVLQALQQYGRTTLVTSGSGISMNNMPLPVQVISRDAYAAGANTIRDEFSQTTEFTPGEIATGFSMVVIPHIQERRKVILQYNLTLSSLDELAEFESGSTTVQLPRTSTRSFSQRVSMLVGQTLVLGGFEQEQRFDSSGFGFLSGGKSNEYGKSIIVVTIDVADAGV